MYKLSIQYGPMEPDDDGMALSEVGEDCEEMADVLAAVEYWLGQDGVSDVSISKTADGEGSRSRDL